MSVMLLTEGGGGGGIFTDRVSSQCNARVAEPEREVYMICRMCHFVMC